jgi:hypothetical protein
LISCGRLLRRTLKWLCLLGFYGLGLVERGAYFENFGGLTVEHV